MNPLNVIKLIVNYGSNARVQVNGVDHFDLIESRNQLLQRLTDGPQRLPVILSAMRGDQDNAVIVVVQNCQSAIVIIRFKRNGPQSVNNRVAGDKDAVLRHSFTQQVESRATGRGEMQTC